MEKVLEFDTIKEFSNCEDVNKTNIDILEMHFDKEKKKYITKVTYGKKA